MHRAADPDPFRALQPVLPRCPSCRNPMEALRAESNRGEPVELDLCFACHGIWFDHRESLQLSAPGVLALFRKLHEHRDDPHLPLKEQMACPRCSSALERGVDRTISGAYIVYRCGRHGRFSTFSSFMVEKGFVRHLNPAEIHALAAQVQTIHCSSCGASVDLRRDHACPYCRSAFSLLDPQAVERALERLQQRATTPMAMPRSEARRAGDTSAEVLIAKERIRQQGERHQREQRRQGWGNASGYPDELWSAGLEVLGRLFTRWL